MIKVITGDQFEVVTPTRNNLPMYSRATITRQTEKVLYFTESCSDKEQYVWKSTVDHLISKGLWVKLDQESEPLSEYWAGPSAAVYCYECNQRVRGRYTRGILLSDDGADVVDLHFECYRTNDQYWGTEG